MTFKIYYHDQGDEQDNVLGSYSFAVIDLDDDCSFRVSAADISWTYPTIPFKIIHAGKLCYLTVKADVAPTGSSQDWFITSHWIMDLDSTYTPGPD